MAQQKANIHTTSISFGDITCSSQYIFYERLDTLDFYEVAFPGFTLTFKRIPT